MSKKTGVEYIAIVAIVAIVAASMVMMFNINAGITGYASKQNDLKIPDKQCYNIAKNLAKAAENVAVVPYSSGTGMNPCTGEITNVSSFIDNNNGQFYRTVFENGDVKGYVPLGTSFLACIDGRAEITSRLGAYYYNKGKAYGLWYNNPHMEQPYKVEKCSTI